jgi:hypothetical protein
MFRTDGAERQQALELVAVALGAFGGVAGSHQLLEFVVAAPARIFVDRHGGKLSRPAMRVPLAELGVSG